LRGHRLADFLINKLLANLNDGFFQVPIIAVVTHDNRPSNKLFSHLPYWVRISLTAEGTNNFSYFSVNGVNIFYDEKGPWGKSSDIYWHNKSADVN